MSQRFYTTLVTFIIATIVSVAANTSDTLATSVPSPTKAESAAIPSAQGENVAGTQHITGTLTDKETKEAVIQATVQLLNAKDSSYVSGTVSNIDGDFSMNVEKPGRYIIKITNIGYKSITRNLTISEGKDFAFGKLSMETDAVLLKEVVANGVAAKVVVKEDTFIYNAAAYHTPEGSVIEELVKRLPGAQIDDDGKITINGKEVKKIMVDGKEFMTGDTQTALKNLPTAIIDKVKAYDEKSDLAKMTGVDDGEEQTVLDFNIKRGMNKGFLANIDLAVGTKSRYAERVMAGYMKDNSRIMVFGNLNNTGDRGFLKRQLGSSMKSVGEVMAIGRTFEEALQKGLRMIGQGMHGFVENHEIKIADIATSLHEPTDMRVFVVSKALQMGYSVEQIHQLTKIDRWFLEKLKHIVNIDEQLHEYAHLSEVSEFMEPSEFKEYLQSPEVALLLRAAKVYGFSDFQIARAVGLEHRMKMEQAGLTIRKWRKMLGLVPTVNQIDTLAAEYPAQTNYLYLSYL